MSTQGQNAAGNIVRRRARPKIVGRKDQIRDGGTSDEIVQVPYSNSDAFTPSPVRSGSVQLTVDVNGGPPIWRFVTKGRIVGFGSAFVRAETEPDASVAVIVHGPVKLASKGTDGTLV